MIIGLLIIAVIGLLIYVIVLKKQKIEEVKINKEIQRQNLLVEAEVRAKQSELDKIKFSIDRENDILQSLTKSSEEMQKSAKEQAQKAYESEISALQELYKEEGAKLDAQNQKKLQAILNKIKEEQYKLQQLENKQMAYVQAQQRQEEINSKQDYYRLVIDKIDLDDISSTELIHFIQENPSLLKRPIIIDERRFQVGYNAEEIRAFIPRELRRLQECNNSDFCPQFTDIKEQYYQDHKCDDGCE